MDFQINVRGMTECNYFLFIYLVSRFICVFIPIYAQISLIGSALVLGYTLSGGEQ